MNHLAPSRSPLTLPAQQNPLAARRRLHLKLTKTTMKMMPLLLKRLLQSPLVLQEKRWIQSSNAADCYSQQQQRRLPPARPAGRAADGPYLKLEMVPNSGVRRRPLLLLLLQCRMLAANLKLVYNSRLPAEGCRWLQSHGSRLAGDGTRAPPA